MMGTAERREREKTRKEREMVEAAKQLFLEKGYAATTMDDIVARLEMSKGGIYHHFASKDEMYYAAAKGGLQIAKEMFETAASQEGTGLEKFSVMGMAYVEFWSAYPDYRKLFRGTGLLVPPMSSGPHGQEFARLGTEINGIMVRQIEEGIKDGSIRRDVSPEMVAFCASSAVDGILNSLEKKGRSRGKGLERDEVLAYLFDTFKCSLASRPENPERATGRSGRGQGGHK